MSLAGWSCLERSIRLSVTEAVLPDRARPILVGVGRRPVFLFRASSSLSKDFQGFHLLMWWKPVLTLSRTGRELRLQEIGKTYRLVIEPQPEER